MKKTAGIEAVITEEEEIYEEKSGFQKWGKIGLYALCGFLFSQPDFLYGMSPFSVAFVGAIPFEYCFSAFVGGALGAFTSLNVRSAVKCTAALFAVCVLRIIKGRYFPKLQKEYLNAVFSFFACFLSALVQSFVLEGELTGFMYIISESAVAFACTLIFCKCFKTPFIQMGLSELSVKESLYFGGSFCVFIMCASGFDVEGLSPVRILCFLLILFTGAYKGVSGAATVGVSLALSLSINEDYRFLFTAVSLGALLSGVVSPLGQTASAIAFALCTSVISAFCGDYGIVCVIEAVVASAVFIIIPQKHVAAFENFMRKKGITADDRVAVRVSESLSEAAENIYGVSQIVSDVSEKLDSIINPEVNRMFSGLQQKVCDGCQKKFLCWSRNFDSTASDVLTIAGIEQNHKVNLKKVCPRFEQMNLYIDEGYKDFAESIETKNKLSEMRRVLTDQFKSMGDFLQSTALSVSESRIPDKGKASVLKTALSDSGIFADSLSCYCNSDSKMTVEITSFDPQIHEQHKRIKAILEFVTKRRFEKAEITVTEIKTVIIFEEKSAYYVQVGSWQKPMKNEKVCGDTIAVIKKKNGLASVILSDGMGTGSRAKIDSTMTCSIMEKLILSGFDFDSALKIVNSSMIMKSTDESIATIDALSVNLFTGRAEFFKAGASITFIRRGNEITVIEAPSLPVGIIRNVEFFKAHKDLEVGDIVLLLSDGATSCDCGWIHDELLSWNTGSMNDLACHIVRLAHLKTPENNRDDITAVAVKITRNRE